ncbi:MAG: hypothetical protein U1E21_25395 [Reyranellaceae bacterium]
MGFKETIENGTVSSVTGIRAIDEYKLLQFHLASYRTSSMSIKNWCVTVCLAVMAAGFVEAQPMLFLVSALAALVFWIMDARWLVYGESFNSRAKDIEEFFSKTRDDYIGPQIEKACVRYREEIRSKYYTVPLMMRRSIHLPHSLILLMGIAAFVLSNLNVIRLGKH